MSFMRKRWTIAAILLALAVPGAWLMARENEPVAGSSITTVVKKSDFKVVVNTSGELRAVKFVQVQGPTNAQQAEAYQMKISSIVPEGTVVKLGDLVAELDRSAIAAKRAEVALALQKAEAQLEQAQLDSTLNLSKAREDMRTMDLTLEEKRIAMEQSKFEAPSVRRQTEIDHEKAERALAQARMDYKTRTEQAQAKMREVGADVQRSRNKLSVVDQVMSEFTIRAPAGGMVIYVKEWNGKKKTAGSQINPWDPTVATLPDMSTMETITYVNEIDVRKISVGHKAAITLDADPTKRLTGTVTQVANVGEQRPNSDAKVFEVRILVAEGDTTLRPGMTTGSAIETYAVKDVMSVPLEAVMAEADVPYVYKRVGSGIRRHEVETGAMNDDAVVILKGLDDGDEVFLSPPADPTGIETVRLPGSADKPKETPGDSAKSRTIPLAPDSSRAGGGPPAPTAATPGPAAPRRS
jgi:RND family efflux transporter MFP subunit